MSRYIKVDDLQAFCDNQADHSITPNDFQRMNYIEIVRCKDCKRGQYQRNGSTGIEYNYCTYRRDITPLNWFCADGERK